MATMTAAAWHPAALQPN